MRVKDSKIKEVKPKKRKARFTVISTIAVNVDTIGFYNSEGYDEPFEGTTTEQFVDFIQKIIEQCGGIQQFLYDYEIMSYDSDKIELDVELLP